MTSIFIPPVSITGPTPTGIFGEDFMGHVVMLQYSSTSIVRGFRDERFRWTKPRTIRRQEGPRTYREDRLTWPILRAHIIIWRTWPIFECILYLYAYTRKFATFYGLRRRCSICSDYPDACQEAYLSFYY